MSKLYSPNGTAEIIPHPSKREQMINDGWTETQPTKKPAVKSANKEESK